MKKIQYDSLQNRSDPPISPRHHASIASNNRSSETISSIMQTPIPSMILRDTSIREQSSSSSIKDSSQTSSSYFRGSSYNNNLNNNTNNNSNSGYNSSSTYSSRERDCSSPFLNSSGGSNSMPQPYNNSNSNQLLLGSRENNSIILRDSGSIQQHTPRVASNRFLSGGLDTQRIIKQSTEDCRRLLQQVSNFSLDKVYVIICLFHSGNSRG